jgi:hypothetical protein
MDAQSTALPDMSGDDFYINLHQEFIERLGYMAGVNGGLYNPPFPVELCQLRWQAWHLGYDNGYVKRQQ